MGWLVDRKKHKEAFMLDFAALRDGKTTFTELVDGLKKEDLRDLTNEMVDTMLALIADCTDADVVFQPMDPDAHDPDAADEVDLNIAWTLGHVIVHATASSEESAALATEMARGVPLHGRSRYETPWETVTTIAQCRERLAESRRIRTESLEMWPDAPHLDIIHQPWPGAPEVDAVGRFVLGLGHDTSHLGQIAEIVRQAKS
jgi:hypothetical protein